MTKIKNTYEAGVCGTSSSSSAAGTGVSWLEFRRPRFRRRDPIRSDCRNDWRALSTDIKHKKVYSILMKNIQNISRVGSMIRGTKRLDILMWFKSKCSIKLMYAYLRKHKI